VKGALDGRHITDMSGDDQRGMYFADIENAILYWPSIQEDGMPLQNAVGLPLTNFHLF